LRLASSAARRNAAGMPTLADLNVSSETTIGQWQVWQADAFGRWGNPALIKAAQPARPIPQPPTIEINLQSADGELPGNDPRSPGTLDVLIPIPPISALIPGARPLTTLDLTIADLSEPIAVTQPALFDTGARVTRSRPLLPTTVGGQASVLVTAVFRDDAGAESAPANKTVVVHDPRRPSPIIRGPTLIWTSRRDSTGSAEIALSWTPLPGHAAYRVYLSDENRLAASLGLALPADAARADIAKSLSDGGGAAGKDAFSLATETPIAVPASGPVHFRAQVPGSLSGVIIARIVPLTAGNVEARFADCGLVCLAVPHDQSPPTPTVLVTPRADGRFDIAIQAIGFRLALLKSFQPNLLGGPPGAPGAAPPEFRLRRTQGAATEALYAREVIRGTMTIEPGGDGAHWLASQIDGPADGFPSFARFTWFAEVRYPAEIGRTVGALDVPSGITPDDGAVEGDLESPWSGASLPQTAMFVPPPPLAPEDATVTRVAAGAQIDIPNPPVAAPAALEPYRIRIWRRDTDQPFALLSPTDAETVAPFSFVDPAAGAEYAIAYVDPIGRVGPVAVLAFP
jgi:hypothetical protein